MKMRDFLEAQAIFGGMREPKVKKVKSDLTFKDFIKFQKDLKEFEEFQKQAHKKEEKAEKKGPGLGQIAIWLVMSFPITGPLYYHWLKTILN